MYKFLLKKVAASVNNVDVPEHFEWSKWLREPGSESLQVDEILSSLHSFQPKLFFNAPELKSFDFKSKKVKIFKSTKKFNLSKEKTIKIFFKLGNSSTKRINIFDAETGKIIFSALLKEDQNESAWEYKNKRGQTSVLKSSPLVSSYNFKPIHVTLDEIQFKSINSKIIELNFKIEKPAAKLKFEKLNSKIIDQNILSDSLLQLKDFTEKLLEVSFNNLNQVPEIFNLEISDVYKLIEKLDRDKKSLKVQTVPVEFLTESPKIQKITILDLENIKVPTYFLKNTRLDNKTVTYDHFIHEEKIRTFSHSLNYPKDPEIHNVNISDSFLEKIFSNEVAKSSSLKPAAILSSEKIEVGGEFLYKFQKEGAEFLANNSIAFLGDELGLGKTYEAILALKTLFELKKIEKALILCKSADIGEASYDEGWSGKLKELAEEIPFAIVQGNDEVRNKIWQKDKKIFVASFTTFFKDFSAEDASLNLFEKFDCVIADEAQNLLPSKKIFSKFVGLEKSGLKYLWFLSSLHPEEIKKELNFQKNSTIIELRRNKFDTKTELPDVIRQDIWHQLDDEQKIEYENTLSLGRERIEKLLHTGNPFIVQSNVFTLIHQLKQVCNFSSASKSSSKTDYLLGQIDTTIKNGKKMLIFSQYDKMGIQKIEQLLNSNKIKYILLHSGLSLGELEAKKRKFRTDKNFHVLLNGIKISRSGINFPEVQYVVHFDQWWNPATVWKIEENISSTDGENINVYNYFTKNTIEEKIKELLLRKGLLRKEIVEFVPAEVINEMISSDEWLNILGINESKLHHNDPSAVQKKKNLKAASLDKLDKLSMDELGRKTEIFFSRLGYKNLFLNKGNFEGEINIIGTVLENNNKVKMVAKCLFSDQVDLDTISEYIESLQTEKNQGRNFIVHFNGLEDKLPIQLKRKIILINKELFTNYLINFRLI